VQAQQPLFGFDEALIQSRLDVARQSLSTAQAEYRQTSQQALSDPRARGQLSILTGKIEEKRAEAQYLSAQLMRSRVLAPRAGVVLMDDPSEWIGRPVSTGERILRIATEGDVEVEAWLPLADAIDLKVGDEVDLFLQADPLTPIRAKLRYVAHEAVDRPEGHQAFRVRATLLQASTQRVGLKGTAKLYGPSVPLGYWMLRRPLATLRTYLAL
jgi:multidrug resistance efflux pump